MDFAESASDGNKLCGKSQAHNGPTINTPRKQSKQKKVFSNSVINSLDVASQFNGFEYKGKTI